MNILNLILTTKNCTTDIYSRTVADTGAVHDTAGVESLKDYFSGGISNFVRFFANRALARCGIICTLFRCNVANFGCWCTY